MSANKTPYPRYSKFQRDLAAATAEQQRQANVVATQVHTASSGSLSRDETAHLTARLSQIAVDQHRQETAAEQDSQSDPIEEDLPDDEVDTESTGTLRRAAALAATDDDQEILPVQDFPAYRIAASTSTSPTKQRGVKITYRDYLARDELPPPPPPPKLTRVDKRRHLVRQTRIAEAAEKTETILLLKGNRQPTDEDLIAVVSQLSDFNKKKRLTVKETKTRARTLRRLERHEAIPIPRRKVNLLNVERQVTRQVLQGQFTRCVQAENDHALRGRDPRDLPDVFFATEYAHGQWVQYEDHTVEWEPHQYYHGYFEGTTGRWIGHLTPDGKNIYLRDGSIGPEYSGFN